MHESRHAHTGPRENSTLRNPLKPNRRVHSRITCFSFLFSFYLTPSWPRCIVPDRLHPRFFAQRRRSFLVDISKFDLERRCKVDLVPVSTETGGQRKCYPWSLGFITTGVGSAIRGWTQWMKGRNKDAIEAFEEWTWYAWKEGYGLNRHLIIS